MEKKENQNSELFRKAMQLAGKVAKSAAKTAQGAARETAKKALQEGKNIKTTYSYPNLNSIIDSYKIRREFIDALIEMDIDPKDVSISVYNSRNGTITFFRQPIEENGHTISISSRYTFDIKSGKIIDENAR